jgi:hypothetical protein
MRQRFRRLPGWTLLPAAPRAELIKVSAWTSPASVAELALRYRIKLGRSGSNVTGSTVVSA